MNTDTQVAPSATTQIPADDQLQALEQQPDTAETKEGDAPETERDKTIRKLQRRIDSRTRGLGERDALIAQLRAELAKRDQDRTPSNDDEPEEKRGYSEEEVERRAAIKAEQAEFAKTVSSKTQAMLKAGKAFDDFSDLAAEVAEDLPFLDSKGRPTPFILALLDADKAESAAELMVHLARNPEVRDELVGLSERQMARKLALIETSISKKPEAKRSNAPKPIEPLAGNSRSNAPSDGDSMQDWVAKERARMKAARAARH